MPLYPKQEPPYYTEANNAAGTKTYVALLNQSGTNPPTATVLENTLGGTVIWTYDATGAYKATLANAFVNHKTVIILQNSAGVQTVYVAYTGVPDDEVLLETYDAGTPANDRLTDTPIQITVYP